MRIYFKTSTFYYYQDTIDGKEGTPSLTPSPERTEKKKKKHEDSESDTEEYKRMKKTKEIQELKVDGDGLVQGKLADPSNFEYDPVKTLIKFYSFFYLF